MDVFLRIPILKREFRVFSESVRGTEQPNAALRGARAVRRALRQTIVTGLCGNGGAALPQLFAPLISDGEH